MAEFRLSWQRDRAFKENRVCTNVMKADSQTETRTLFSNFAGQTAVAKLSGTPRNPHKSSYEPSSQKQSWSLALLPLMLESVTRQDEEG